MLILAFGVVQNILHNIILNLDLGVAATRNVGKECKPSQLCISSSFNGYQKLPDGIIIQWGKSTSGTVGTIIGGFVGGALAAWEMGRLWN
ncbi:hypothetical protein ACPRSC_11130 [Enterobacter asburiae]|jgi:hypothetical protein|uniref:Uncharacterized protein n=2 Tax=Enterobacter TaxID=547 RepID=A0AAQ0XQ14_ENTAS|nr:MULTISPECIES: hypothetical protein [Enterobacter]MBS7117832.1 hypothetical protein [Enterobacter cloacae]ELW9467898.1 hypothetical protein [Enterobacter asburiae]KAA0523191.1 hypothetical protein F0321_18390 [Enterobacter asburiae]KAA0531931.1 hypothetical protein F0320_13310 [Enterobacter dykesii]KGI65684.1 hypothetical protein LA04_02350 [Enterobacter sp. UCD-UG_FMILLET]